MRLNKFLSEAGLCSRREADRLVEAGRVTVNGKPASSGMQVEDSDQVCLDGNQVKPQERKVLLLFYKPKGIECTANLQVKKNVISYIQYPIRVYYAGRLDKDSEGLLLLTNQGDLVNEIMKAGNFHEKEYLVTVDRPVTEEFLQKIRTGVLVLGTITRPCVAEKRGEYEFQIVLTQGLNRQIRRMCSYLGYEVKKLKRTRIMNLTLENLKVGEYREASKAEVQELKRQIEEGKTVRKKEVYRGEKPVKNPGKYRNPEKKFRKKQ